MSIIVKQVQDKLSAAISAAFEKSISAGTLPEAEIPAFNIEVPADRANGDFSTNAAMAGARVFRRAPRQIADEGGLGRCWRCLHIGGIGRCVGCTARLVCTHVLVGRLLPAVDRDADDRNDHSDQNDRKDQSIKTDCFACFHM